MMETATARTAVNPQFGWVDSTLGEACELIMGQSPPSSAYNENGEGMPFFQGKTEFGELHPVAVKWCSAPTKTAQPGDVLLSVRAPVGPTNLADQLCCIGRGLAAVRPKNGMLSKYVLYYLRSIAADIDALGTGTTFKAVSGKVLRDVSFPVAPLTQQRRIVEAIELQLGRLDAAVARLQGAKARLKRYKQAVLKAAYDQFEKRPLEELTSVITKGASPSWQGVKYVNDPGQTLFVTSENVREGFLDLDEPKYVENSFNELQKRSMLKHGDVLLNIVGASIGRAAIYDRDDLANTNQAVCLIRTTEDLDNGFLCNYLNSEEAKTYYSRNQVDVARANLSLKDVRELPVPFAPIEQQRSFKERVDGQLGSANEMDATLDAQLQQAVRLRQAVLKRAFEGRLVTTAS